MSFSTKALLALAAALTSANAAVLAPRESESGPSSLNPLPTPVNPFWTPGPVLTALPSPVYQPVDFNMGQAEGADSSPPSPPFTPHDFNMGEASSSTSSPFHIHPPLPSSHHPKRAAEPPYFVPQIWRANYTTPVEVAAFSARFYYAMLDLSVMPEGAVLPHPRVYAARYAQLDFTPKMLPTPAEYAASYWVGVEDEMARALHIARWLVRGTYETDVSRWDYRLDMLLAESRKVMDPVRGEPEAWRTLLGELRKEQGKINKLKEEAGEWYKQGMELLREVERKVRPSVLWTEEEVKKKKVEMESVGPFAQAKEVLDPFPIPGALELELKECQPCYCAK